MLENDVKELLSKNGIPVPIGTKAGSGEEAAQAWEQLSGPCVVKALIPMGKKGKAGLVRKAGNRDEVRREAELLLGMKIGGYVISNIIVEEMVPIDRELYVSIAYDSLSRSPVMLFSPQGGVEIETFAQENPDRLFQTTIDILEGLHPFMARDVCFRAGLTPEQTKVVAPILVSLYALFYRCDAKLLEINPLAITAAGAPVAVGALLNIDEEALYRHPEMEKKIIYGQERSLGEMTERERKVMEADQAAPGSGAARFTEFEDGEIGFGIIGGGSSLTAIDTIIREGSRPANYCDLGPGKDFERKLEVLYETILNRPGIRAFICGANIAAAIDVFNMAVIIKRIIKKIGIDPKKIPILVRIAGFNDENIRQEFENWPGVHYYGSEISIEKAAEKVVALLHEQLE
jgi:succinyl-CoA synthetase beta subunit/citryl-CoA synthetase large subunit